MYGVQEAIKAMIGRTIASVKLDAGRDEITFTFADGHKQAFGVEGDCCSHSWIEHMEAPDDVVGAVLLFVDDSGPIMSDHPEHDEENGGDSISVYNTRFNTDRGTIVLEFRNSSNGYYGGYLVCA